MRPIQKNSRTFWTVIALETVSSVLLITLLAGCGSPTTLFIDAADSFVNTTVGPEYLDYVESDKSLTADEKLDRINNVQTFRDAVLAAQRLKGG